MILRKKRKYIENLKRKIDYLKKKEKMLSLNIETKPRDLYVSNLSLKSINNQMNDIFLHMNDGFFFIDKNFYIQDYYSAATSKILNLENPSQLNLLDVLSKFINKKKFNSAKDYFELMFNKDIEEYTLMEINPLDLFEVPYHDEFDQHKRRFINLTATRVFVDGEIQKVIIKLQDLTDQEELNQELKDSEIKKKLIMDLMIDVIASDPDMIVEYIEESENNIKKLNDIMKNQDNREISKIIIQIGKIIHTMKGGALSLNLNLIVKDIHNFEDEIKHLNENKNVSGEDLIAMVFSIQKLQDYFTEVKNLVNRLKKFNTDSHLTKKYLERDKQLDLNNYKIIDFLNNMLSQYNKKYNVLVNLKFNLKNEFPLYLYETIKTILIQFLNNSYSHGLDPHIERINLQKNTNMLIEISSYIKNGQFYVIYKDDGKGIDIEEIRKVLLKKYNKSKDYVNKKTPKELLQFLFMANFSTTINISELSGRGMGLPIIYSEIKKQSGKINIQFKKGMFTSFTVIFPLIDEEVYV